MSVISPAALATCSPQWDKQWEQLSSHCSERIEFLCGTHCSRTSTRGSAPATALTAADLYYDYIHRQKREQPGGGEIFTVLHVWPFANFPFPLCAQPCKTKFFFYMKENITEMLWMDFYATELITILNSAGVVTLQVTFLLLYQEA